MRTRFAKVGTTMQSQTGRHSPVTSAMPRPEASDRGACRSMKLSLAHTRTAAAIIAPNRVKGMVCSSNPAAPVPMRTSGIGSPRASNIAEDAMSRAIRGVPAIRNR